jgi:hypothetical protein
MVDMTLAADLEWAPRGRPLTTVADRMAMPDDESWTASLPFEVTVRPGSLLD